MVSRLLRLPWSLALVGGLVLALLVAGVGGSSLFGLTWSDCEIWAPTQCPNAKMPGDDLRGTDVGAAYLSKAELDGAELSAVNLCKADLSGAKLAGANLSGALLQYANLPGADLSGANLSGAMLQQTRFCNTVMPDGNKRNDGC